ncbi:MAG: hypothetical protein QXD04_06805 [Candidatus Bathyarchaeia archaeon]
MPLGPNSIIYSYVPYFDTFNGEVMKYRDARMLKENLRRALEEKTHDVLERTRSFVGERS